MADATSNIDKIQQSQSQKEVPANDNFDAASTSMVFARHASACAALTWGYYGGRINGTSIANGTVSATASNTNYVVVHRTTFAVSVATTTTNWNDAITYGRAYKLTAGTATITDWEDHRFSNDGSGIFDIGDVTVLNDSITNAKLANMANNTYKGRRTAGTGDPEDVSLANLKTDLGLTGTNSGDQTITLTSDVTGSGTGSFATTIANDAVSNAKAANMANATIKGRTMAGTGDPEDLTAAQAAAILGTNIKSTESLIVACSDETTALTAGTNKVTFRMPYAFTVTDVRGSLTTAQASGSIFTVDINESGTSILSTKLTIDNTELTSTTAATPRVISDTSLADDAAITADIDQIGDGTATGLKITLIGTRT
jgi:hypothetical protein